MQWRRLNPILFLSIFLICTSYTKREEGDERAIREKTKSYEDAFNRQDAEALAALWAEDARYVNPETGEEIVGRDALEELFQENFQESGDAKLQIRIDSLTFLNPNQANETGTALVKQDDELLQQTAYKATYEKQNGEWLITEVREVEFLEPPTQYEHLKHLEWLVGEWVDEDEHVKIVTQCQWDKYKNFLTQHFSVEVLGKLQLEGRQVIAWDPVNERIRSWVFDSDGGFGEGTWKKKERSWVVETAQTLADGRRASAINIYTPVNQNSYQWESVGREVGGELLPNVGPITVVRRDRSS